MINRRIETSIHHSLGCLDIHLFLVFSCFCFYLRWGRKRVNERSSTLTMSISILWSKAKFRGFISHNHQSHKNKKQETRSPWESMIVLLYCNFTSSRRRFTFVWGIQHESTKNGTQIFSHAIKRKLHNRWRQVQLFRRPGTCIL